MSNLIITGIIDGPLSGGLPKAMELYVLEDIADLSIYGVGSATNGGGSAGVEFALPAVGATKGDYIYVASEADGFTTYFGFAPDYTTSALNVNGDDAVELFMDGVVVDTIGVATEDGTGTAWDYLDGWAVRKPGSAPTATFDAAQWTFSGVNANDGQATNATATMPFPVKSFAPAVDLPLQISAVLGNTTGADTEYVEFTGNAGASLEGYSLIVVESDAGTEAGRIDKQFDFTADHVLGENGVFLLGNPMITSAFGVSPNAELADNFIENSSYTIALVETASITGNTVAGTEVVVDAVGVADGGAEDVFFFDAPVVGPDGGFLPAGFRRDGDTFAQLNFQNDLAINTPTAGTVSVNPDNYPEVKIHQIQGETALADGTLVGVAGAADESPMLGQDVRIQAVVTQVMPGLGGFYVQEEAADADDNASTSEGIFVRGSIDGIAAGDLVTVLGRVGEFGGETGLTAASITVDGTADIPDAVVVDFPTATVLRDADGDYVANLEAYEGMLVTIQQDMTVGELFQTDRFGTIRVSSDGRIDTFTQVNAPSVEGYQQHLKDVASRSIVLDDGTNAQNPAEILIPGLGEDGKLDAGDQFRMGDAYTSISGVVSFSEDSAASNEEPEYRIHLPEAELEQRNPREDAPDVGGTMKVASFNVLNYFTTLDGGTGADGSQNPRGANNQTEFERQEAKLVTAINAIDADVIGLTEIENDPLGSTSLLALTAALNAAGGTYGYVDAGVIEGAMGGTLEGDAIKNGFLYNTETVSLNGDFAILDETVDADFQTVMTQRPSIAQTFTEKASGESFTAVINHLKSKGSVVDGDADALDGQSANATVRENAAKALVDWLATDPTGTGEEDILVLGDLNSYRMEDAITAIRNGADDTANTADDYTDLGAEFDPEGTSYVFDGQVGTLDYALANGSLKEQVTGAAYWNINADEADALDYNTDFGRDTTLLTEDPYRASDHDPVVVGLDLGEKAAPQPQVFTLELLHMSDQEGNGSSVVYAPNAAKVMNALEAQDLGNDGIADNTIRLSSGDAIIPGAFYDASAAVFGSGGIGDIQIQNELGFEAIALGNHEFDKGTAELAGLISGNAEGNFDALVGSTLEGQDFTGTNMPYLSTNLNVTPDANLAPLATAGGQVPKANSIASSTIIQKGGEQIGVIGATTPTLTRLSSTGDVVVEPAWAGTTPTAAELDALAAEIQTEVDAVLEANPGMNKVVLLAHMQVIDIETQLALRLKDVDVIVAGGSNTRLLDENDTPVGDDEVQGEYPIFVENADGGMTAVVNTDGNYKYVGRLVVDFDAEGRVIPESYDPEVSGAYATDDAGVARLGAEDMGDAEVQAIADAIEEQIVATQGNVFGRSDVFLNGNRTGTDTATDPDGVRSQETNLGNLTADANLYYAKQVDDTVMVSIKNGGGIRASIGETTVPAGGTDFVRGPTGELLDSDGNVIKPAGGISQADIATALAFNNALSLVSLTRAELVAILEHGATIGAGQFAQMSGIQYSFDPDLPEGERILNATITDANGKDLDVLVRDGEIVGDAEGLIRVVTLSFMADGGDGYPFPEGGGRDRIDLETETRDGAATFANNGTEQDAFAEYLAANHNTAETAIDAVDTGPEGDDRIQNVNFRDDTVIDADEFEFVQGSDAAYDILVGTDADEIFVSGAGAYDEMTGGAGADMFVFGTEALDGVRERDTITDYEVGVDSIGLGEGVSVDVVKMMGDIAVVYLNDPENRQDAIYVRGAGLTADNLTFAEYDPLLN